MLALARVRVLEDRAAVEARQAMGILREVARHPVEDHADAGLVQPVHEVAQVVGFAEAARRRKVAGRLVAPGFIERVLGDRQQLDMREAEIRDPGHELVGDLAIVHETAVRAAPPGAEVDFVHRERRVQPGSFRALREPGGVAPCITRTAPQ